MSSDNAVSGSIGLPVKDPLRWALVGTQADADYKAGLWHSDAQDMLAAAPGLRDAADDWDAQSSQLSDVRRKLRSSRGRLVDHQGDHAGTVDTALDAIDAELARRISDIDGIGTALRRQAEVLEDSHAVVAQCWAAWEASIADPVASYQHAAAMSAPVNAMVQALLAAADSIQLGAGLVARPETPLPSSRIAPALDTGRSRAGDLPGTLVRPTDRAEVRSPVAHGGATTDGPTPATAPGASEHVSLAGSGPATVAPPVQTAPHTVVPVASGPAGPSVPVSPPGLVAPAIPAVPVAAPLRRGPDRAVRESVVGPTYRPTSRALGIAAGLLGRAVRDTDFGTIGVGSIPHAGRQAADGDVTIRNRDAAETTAGDPLAGKTRAQSPVRSDRRG